MTPSITRGLILVAAALSSGAAFAQDTAEAQFKQGRELFLGGAQPACALCHTLKDAQSEGAIGPVLDDLKPDAERVAKALRTGLGSMPSFRDKLTDAQIAVLARYVSQAAAGNR